MKTKMIRADLVLHKVATNHAAICTKTVIPAKIVRRLQGACTLLVGLAMACLADSQTAKASQSIPVADIGTEAAKRYPAEVAEVEVSREGAILRAVMQDLEGHATREGLWLTSKAEEDEGKSNRFLVRAIEFGREEMLPLPSKGDVRANGDLVEWVRPGVVEEYRVGGDGLRQDFLVSEKPEGRGELAVGLEILGATAKPASYGAALTVDSTGRELAYHRLRVSDAKGRELPARMEVASNARLVLRVDDQAAEYPVRIDPTFSDADWIAINPGIPGANDMISAFAVDSNNNLYIGGSFTFIGNVEANYIAKWSGSQWSPLGTGMNRNARIHALAVDADDNLYAGGEFNRAGGVFVRNIAFWDGTAWTRLGFGANNGVNNTVYALAVDTSRNHLYAGGIFTETAGFVQATNIARWDAGAESWEALFDNANNFQGTNGPVLALAVDSANRIVYAGGDFTRAADDMVDHVAAWINGNNWVELNDPVGMDYGTDAVVRALALDSTGLLYAGGDFNMAGGKMVWRVASWNRLTNTWSPLQFGLDFPVHALAVDRANKLYAGGEFTKIRGAAAANNVDANRIAKWDPSIMAWSPLGNGVNNTVRTIATTSQNLVYAGGDFTKVDDAEYADRIADWDGNSWGILGEGLNDQVSTLVVDSSGNLYAAGKFKAAGTEVVNGVAKWNGSQWSKLGSGVNGDINALALDSANGLLYAGGAFTRAGNVDAFKIARYRLSGSLDWLAVGNNGFFGGDVFALAFTAQGNLLAGGSFTHTANAAGAMGNTALPGLAIFTNNLWTALGAGPGQTVYALAVDGQTIYAGGSFANFIRQWNGTAWSVVGAGVNNTVRALALDANANLYAGGQFTTAGGAAAMQVARWNKSAWSPLGSGLNNNALALTVDGKGLVYAGGSFTSAGGVTANRTAVWDPVANKWGALGSGANQDVTALAAFGKGTLYAGGRFLTIGGKVSPFIAQLDTRTAPVISFTKPANQVYSPDRKFPLSATSTSGETVSFSSSDSSVVSIQGNEATIEGAGTVTITASVPQSGDWKPATPVSHEVTIAKANQSVTFEVLDRVFKNNAKFNLTATASSGEPVVFSSSNSKVVSIGGRQATIRGAGTVEITATAPASANYNEASVIREITIEKADQTIRFPAPTTQTFGPGKSIGLTANSTSGLSVSYSSSNSKIVSIKGNVASILGAGTVRITAKQAGNSNWNAAEEVEVSLTIAKGNQKIVFGNPGDKKFKRNGSFTLAGTATSKGKLVFKSSNSKILTIQGNKATMKGKGKVTITATQPGDKNWKAATAVSRTFAIIK